MQGPDLLKHDSLGGSHATFHTFLAPRRGRGDRR